MTKSQAILNLIAELLIQEKGYEDTIEAQQVDLDVAESKEKGLVSQIEDLQVNLATCEYTSAHRKQAIQEQERTIAQIREACEKGLEALHQARLDLQKEREKLANETHRSECRNKIIEVQAKRIEELEGKAERRGVGVWIDKARFEGLLARDKIENWVRCVAGRCLIFRTPSDPSGLAEMEICWANGTRHSRALLSHTGHGIDAAYLELAGRIDSILEDPKT